MGLLTLHISFIQRKLEKFPAFTSFQADTTLGHTGIPHLTLRGKSPTTTSFQGSKKYRDLFLVWRGRFKITAQRGASCTSNCYLSKSLCSHMYVLLLLLLKLFSLLSLFYGEEKKCLKEGSAFVDRCICTSSLHSPTFFQKRLSSTHPRTHGI